jgi:hypothetical protein
MFSESIVSRNNVIRRAGSALFVSVIVISLLSSISAAAGYERYSGWGSPIVNASAVINRSSRPLVAGERWDDIFTLVHKSRPETEYLFIKPEDDIDFIRLKRRYSDIFIIAPSDGLKKALKSKGMSLSNAGEEAVLKID